MLFGPSANLFLKIGLCVIGAAIIGGVALAWAVPHTDYVTRVGFPVEQPIPFSHKHHVGGLGLDCRYCHNTVENTAQAGMPSSDTCMTCHSQIWSNAPMLAPLRASLVQHKPLIWKRVNDVPDYVYFNHGIHVAKGVACESCHGRVDEMPLSWRAQDLEMRWCLGCHRDPAPRLRPRQQVFSMGWQRAATDPSGTDLMRLYHIRNDLTDCTTCHR